LPDVEGAIGRQVAIDDLDDAAGPRAHHHDLARQEHRLGDRVGDEDHGLAGLFPQPQQLLVEVVAGNLVERAERLVHHQQLGLTPLTVISPSLCWARSAMTRSRVVLPQPDGPMKETNSPWRTVRSMSASANTGWSAA